MLIGINTSFNSYNNNYNPAFGADISKLTKNKLIKLKEQGLSDEKIAQMYNCSEIGVRRRRNRYGVEGLSKNFIDYSEYDYYYLKILTEEGNSLSQIAKFYKKGVHTIRQVLAHFDLKTMEATFAAAVKKEELKARIDAGETQKEIADAFYLEDERTVTHLVKKFGLETPIHKVDKLLSMDKIAELIFRGMKPEDIAQKYSVDVSSIIQNMKKSGFWEIYKELYQPHDIPKDEIIGLIKSGYSISEIAEMNHVSLDQMVRYMQKNNILKKNIPIDDLIQSVKNGMTIKEIAVSNETYKNRVPKILAENDLKTKGQIMYNKSVPKELVEKYAKECSTYTELAEKLHVSPSTAKSLTERYDTPINIEVIIYPDIKDVKELIKNRRYISIDEIAQILDVKPEAVERVLANSKTKIKPPHKIKDFDSFEFTKWVNFLLQNGDSPVQIGELVGLSSKKARKILEKISKLYEGDKFFEFAEIPKDKKSPDKADITKVIKSSINKEYKSDFYGYNKIYNAKDSIKLCISKKFNISVVTVDALIAKYDLDKLLQQTSLLITS